jgi:hypothetical protein
MVAIEFFHQYMWKPVPRQSREKTSCEKSIKQNAWLAVKLALSSAALALTATNSLSTLAYAEDPPPPPDSTSPDSNSADSNQGALPDIEAKMRQLKVLKASTSRRVYLIELQPDAFQAQAQPQSQDQTQAPPPPADGSSGDTGAKPPVQKILLIRNGEENVMGLRVLRDITGTPQVIVKRIKQYPNHDSLDIGQDYFALEKISDVIPPPPTPQDKADMAEVEPAPLAFDPDLDTGSSPSPDDDDDGSSHQDRLGASIEEKNVPFEKQRHWISAAFGVLRNTPDQDKMNGRYYYSGGIRYGYDIIRRLFVTKDEHLDTFTLEGSVFYYSISGLDSSSASTDSSSTTTTATDTYTLTPVVATGRYTYYYNEDFGIFVYGGLMKNIVMNSQNSNADRVGNLGGVVPAVGAGAVLRVGPQWYTRIDAGLDMFAANLMIRF